MLGLPYWPWVAPSSSVSSALYFLHLYTYHSVLVCLSPWLDHHLIFLFPQPLAQGSGQMLKNVCQEMRTSVPPHVERKQGCPCLAVASVKLQNFRPCLEMLECCAVGLWGTWARGASMCPILGEKAEWKEPGVCLAPANLTQPFLVG